MAAWVNHPVNAQCALTGLLKIGERNPDGISRNLGFSPGRIASRLGLFFDRLGE
jgi:hypothetical protein